VFEILKNSISNIYFTHRIDFKSYFEIENFVEDFKGIPEKLENENGIPEKLKSRKKETLYIR
jgi:hypothetical protein